MGNVSVSGGQQSLGNDFALSVSQPEVTPTPTPDPEPEPTPVTTGGTAEIRGKYYIDGNSNGERESYEHGVANERVDLVNSSGVVVESLKTFINGTFIFDDVAAGTYSLRFYEGSSLAGIVSGVSAVEGQQSLRNDFGLTSTPVVEPPAPETTIVIPPEGEGLYPAP